MYSSIVSLSTAPTVPQKYPLAHICCPQYLFFNSGNSSCINFDDLPFKYCIIWLGDRFVGHDNSICTWSLPIAPSKILIPFTEHPCFINSRSLKATFPFNMIFPQKYSKKKQVFWQIDSKIKPRGSWLCHNNTWGDI